MFVVSLLSEDFKRDHRKEKTYFFKKNKYIINSETSRIPEKISEICCHEVVMNVVKNPVYVVNPKKNNVRRTLLHCII